MDDRPGEQAAGAVTAENLRLLGGPDADGKPAAARGGVDGEDGASSTPSVMGTTVGAGGLRCAESDAGVGDEVDGPTERYGEGVESSPLEGDDERDGGAAGADGLNSSTAVHAHGECAPAPEATDGSEDDDEADSPVEPSLVRLALDGYTPADSPLAGPTPPAAYRGGGAGGPGRRGRGDRSTRSEQSAVRGPGTVRVKDARSNEAPIEEEAGDDQEETSSSDKPSEFPPQLSQMQLLKDRSPLKLARRCFAAQEDTVDDGQYLAMPNEFLRARQHEGSEEVSGRSDGIFERVRRTRTWDEDRGRTRGSRGSPDDGTAIRHAASFGPSNGTSAGAPSFVRRGRAGGAVRELHHRDRRPDVIQRGGTGSRGGPTADGGGPPSGPPGDAPRSSERDEIGRLNRELAECRAEIGRLRSSGARVSFVSIVRRFAASVKKPFGHRRETPEFCANDGLARGSLGTIPR